MTMRIITILLCLGLMGCAAKAPVDMTQFSTEYLLAGRQQIECEIIAHRATIGDIQFTERMPGNTIYSITGSGVDKLGHALAIRRIMKVQDDINAELAKRGVQ